MNFRRPTMQNISTFAVCFFACTLGLASCTNHPHAPAGTESELGFYGKPLPEFAMVRLGSLNLRHKDGVRHVSFSQDGKTLRTRCFDGAFGLWDATTGKRHGTLTWAKDSGFGPVFSSDGKLLALISSETEDVEKMRHAIGQVSIRRWPGGKEIRRILLRDQRISHVRFSPDGKTLAVAMEDAKPEEIKEEPPLPAGLGVIRFYGLAPGKLENDTAGIGIFEVASGKQIRAWKGHAGRVDSMSLSADGRLIASIDGTRSVFIWETTTGRKVVRLSTPPKGAYTVEFHPTRPIVAIGCVNGSIRFSNALSDKSLLKITVSKRGVHTLAWSPDGKILAAQSHLDHIRLWDTSNGKRIADIECPSLMMTRTMTFSADGKKLAAGTGDKIVFMWEVPGGKNISPTQGHSYGVSQMAFSNDNKTLISIGDFDETIRFWNTSTGKQIRRIKSTGLAYNAALSADHSKAASITGFGEKVRLLDLTGGNETIVIEANRYPRNLVFSRDGKVLVTGGASSNDRIELWSTSDGKRIKSASLGQNRVSEFASGPENLLAVMMEKNERIRGHYYKRSTEISLWDIQKLKEILKIDMGHNLCRSLGFTGNGKYLAGISENKVCLWDVKTGKTLRQVDIGETKTRTLVVTTDNGFFVLGCEKGAVQVWDFRTAKRIWAGRAHMGYVNDLVLSADGKLLASCGSEGTIVIWDMEKIKTSKSK